MAFTAEDFKNKRPGDELQLKTPDIDGSYNKVYFHSVFAERLNYKDAYGHEVSVELSKVQSF